MVVTESFRDNRAFLNNASQDLSASSSSTPKSLDLSKKPLQKTFQSKKLQLKPREKEKQKLNSYQHFEQIQSFVNLVMDKKKFIDEEGIIGKLKFEIKIKRSKYKL
ncbi:hypothetical protein BpHYR1_038518 [Brachionus plicatilis]|uniref:Uncharacterized protein n=1 Tax=Brachionus plicatilis TaxID=10195 RepID=A0A3M7Q0H6_BRAPC|nr:hypothetical protein BpHYR1_038518 [Brachionus plicatilis]